MIAVRGYGDGPATAKTSNEERRSAMEVTLPADLNQQVEEELARGRFKAVTN
jgi:hypothetical protein